MPPSIRHSKVAPVAFEENSNWASRAAVAPSLGPESIVVSGRTLIVTVPVVDVPLDPSLTV